MPALNCVPVFYNDALCLQQSPLYCSCSAQAIHTNSKLKAPVLGSSSDYGPAAKSPHSKTFLCVHFLGDVQVLQQMMAASQAAAATAELSAAPGKALPERAVGSAAAASSASGVTGAAAAQPAVPAQPSVAQCVAQALPAPPPPQQSHPLEQPQASQPIGVALQLEPPRHSGVSDCTAAATKPDSGGNGKAAVAGLA
jgi:hypothetical protein